MVKEATARFCHRFAPCVFMSSPTVIRCCGIGRYG